MEKEHRKRQLNHLCGYYSHRSCKRKWLNKEHKNFEKLCLMMNKMNRTMDHCQAMFPPKEDISVRNSHVLVPRNVLLSTKIHPQNRSKGMEVETWKQLWEEENKWRERRDWLDNENDRNERRSHRAPFGVDVDEEEMINAESKSLSVSMIDSSCLESSSIQFSSRFWLVQLWQMENGNVDPRTSDDVIWSNERWIWELLELSSYDNGLTSSGGEEGFQRFPWSVDCHWSQSSGGVYMRSFDEESDNLDESKEERMIVSMRPSFDQ